MEEGFSHGLSPIILYIPFLKTAQTKIDVHVWTLSVEFDDIVMRFNILTAMKHPSKGHFVFHVNIIDDVVDIHVSNFHPLYAMEYSFVSKLFEFAYIYYDNVDVEIDVYAKFDVDEAEFHKLWDLA